MPKHTVSAERPYEQAILHAVEHCDILVPRITIEPLAGLARASRLLIDKGIIDHAFLNDTEIWPRYLHGYNDAEAPLDRSPRIDDDAEHLNGLIRYRSQVSVSQMDWNRFTKLHAGRQAIWIFDPPYSNETIIESIFREHANKHGLFILFAPASFQWPYNFGNVHRFQGPRQAEQMIHYAHP